jgi:ribonuclease HI
MRKWGQDIKIIFTKVAAHTNIKYNELADKTAKRGLTEGNGVPEIKLFENMTLYNEE